MLESRVLGRIVDSGFVAVIRAENSDDALRIADACAEGGAGAVEITFTVPGAARVIEDLSKRIQSSGALVGAGTVLHPETARIAILSGAQFVVSPALSAETAKLCSECGIPYLPGAATVREILDALECGAEIVKIFPGEVLGPAFVKAVKTVLPQVSLMATGGVTLENVGEWIKSGCVAVGVGGYLTRSAANGNFRMITELTKRFIDEIRKAQP